MSDERRQHELQEYLDGRMNDEERERFEQRLAGDEELATRVAAAQDLRKALRTDDETLSGAFYTRTVAEFSARQRRRLPLGLTWGSVGLAAAALAAAAIFVPPMLRDEIPLKPENAPIDERLSQDLDLAGEPTAGAKGDSVDRLEKKQAPVHPRVDPNADPADSPDAAESRARRQASPPQPVEAPEPAPVQPAPDQEPELELLAQEQLRPASPTEDYVSGKLRTPSPPPAVAKTEAFRFKDESSAAEGQSMQHAVKESEEDTTVTSNTITTFGDLRRDEFAPVELPAGAVGAGEIEILDPATAKSMLGDGWARRSDLETTTEQEAGRDAAKKAKAAFGTRIVAIGAHPGLDTCADLAVRRTETAWEITYRNSGSSVGAVVCGLTLPADGLEIRFEGWRVEP